MAWGIYLNFEKLALQIVEDELEKMTNDNLSEYDCDAIDEEKFINNMYHGSIASTFIVNLYETTLNTILGRRLECTEKEIFKTSYDVKLQLICTMYGVDITEIKSDNSYSCFRSIEKLRNDIIHYKSNAITHASFISMADTISMGTSKEAISLEFTKDYIKKCYVGVVNLLEKICNKCGLVLYKDCLVVDCDGRDSACEFVLTQEMYDCRSEDEYK